MTNGLPSLLLTTAAGALRVQETIKVNTHARTHAHARTRTHTHTRTHARTHTRTHPRTHTHTHTHTHSHARAHRRNVMRTEEGLEWEQVGRQNLKSLVILFAEVSFANFEGIGELNATDVRQERIPLLWFTVRETALANGFCSNLGDTRYPCVCRSTQLPGRGVHSEKVRETGRR